MRKNNKQKGFVILATTLIIGALVVLLIIGVYISSIGEMEKGDINKTAQENFHLANFCSEKALNEIRKDLSYSGETLDNCTITVNNQIINVKVENEDIFKRIKINYSTNDKITIDDWQEVTIF